jgi:hypothetical protein
MMRSGAIKGAGPFFSSREPDVPAIQSYPTPKQIYLHVTPPTENSEEAYFGGIIYPVVGGSQGSPYAATGTASVTTNATNNRVGATFTGSDPFGTNTLTVQFGGFTGTARARSTFVDDTRYAALENPDTPSQVNDVNIQLNGNPAQGSQVAMVTSGTVPSNNLLPSGLCNSCQFLQWGYWTGELRTPNAGGTAVIREDYAHLNPWVAGLVSTTLPAAGIGTFSGNAIGSVVNSGASYLASSELSRLGRFHKHLQFRQPHGGVHDQQFRRQDCFRDGQRHRRGVFGLIVGFRSYRCGQRDLLRQSSRKSCDRDGRKLRAAGPGVSGIWNLCRPSLTAK